MSLFTTLIDKAQALAWGLRRQVPPRVEHIGGGATFSITLVPPTADDFKIVALTVWAECRGEPIVGQQAVTWVILNRARNPRWWGKNLREVCLREHKGIYQFSCWGDQQRKFLDDPKTLELPSYKAVAERVRAVLNGLVPDPTHGCDHYCATRTVPSTSWAHKDGVIRPHTIIGNHSFFKLELP